MTALLAVQLLGSTSYDPYKHAPRTLGELEHYLRVIEAHHNITDPFTPIPIRLSDFSIEGLEQLSALCNADFGTPLTREAIIRFRGQFCIKRRVGADEAMATPLREVAEVLSPRVLIRDEEFTRNGLGRRYNSSEIAKHVNMRERQLQNVFDACLLAATKTGFSLEEVERRVLALISACRGLLLWERDARRLTPQQQADARLSGIEHDPASDYFNEFGHKLTVAWEPVRALAVRYSSSITDLPVNKGSSIVRKITILFISANPIGMDRLKLDEEVREIQGKIRSSEYRDSLELITRWAVRPDDLIQALNEHKPDIVHFSGHGSPMKEIILLDDHGHPKPVRKKALVSVFQTLRDNIRVVVLNACFSKVQAKAITEVIDCAIGTRRAIGDDAAITFAASFYRAIAFGRSVKEAFDQGKAALEMEDMDEKTLVILTRNTVKPESIILIRE